MKANDNIPQLDALNHIQKVEVSPFLWTRIHQKIKNAETPVYSKTVSWSLGLTFVLLLILNVSLLLKQNRTDGAVRSVAQSMNLLTDNDLYK